MIKIGRITSLLILPLIVEVVYCSLKGFLFNHIPDWNFEVTIFLYGVFCMIGAGYCHLDHKHVAVEALRPYLSPRMRRVFGVISELIVIFVVVSIILVSVPAAYRSTLMREASAHQTPFNPPIWWFRWVIPISCFLIMAAALQHLYLLIKNKDYTPPADDTVTEVVDSIKRGGSADGQ